jgi:protocatechuate 3,4-dioxygenase beta subunit
MDTQHDNSTKRSDATESSHGITRRTLLRHAGIVGLAAATGGSFAVGEGIAAATTAAAIASAASLALTPEQEEGPFYVAIEKIRKQISLGQAGVPLQLKIKVIDTTGKAIKGAACDIWQCNALGIYSDESSESTLGQTYLRGVQLTDAEGLAEFDTVYPGHYSGRTTHIHVKVHIAGKVKNGVYSAGHVSHTGQMLFDDAVTSQVYQLAPYTSDTATRVLNSSDRVYTDQGGSKSMVSLTALGSSVSDGFLGAIKLVVNPKSTPTAVGVSTSDTDGPGSTPSGGSPAGTSA